MIISHKHRFIFIKTRKTASTSVEIALSTICGPNDVLTPLNPSDEALREQISGRTAQNYKIPFHKYSLKDWLRYLFYLKPVDFYNHMPARVLKKYLPEQSWNSYFKFCIERNPVDKCISHYLWRNKKVNYQDFQEYLDSGDYKLIQGAGFYQDRNGDLLVDQVYKMEELSKAFISLNKKFGLTKNQLNLQGIHTKNSNLEQDQLKATIKNDYSGKILSLFAGELERYSL